jgi:hypothetical protein
VAFSIRDVVAFKHAEAAAPAAGLTAAMARAAVVPRWHFGRVRSVDGERGTLDVAVTSNAGTPLRLTVEAAAASRVRIAAAPVPPPREVHRTDAVVVTRRDADGVAAPNGAALSLEHATALLDAQDGARAALDMLAAFPVLRAANARQRRRAAAGAAVQAPPPVVPLGNRPHIVAVPVWRRARQKVPPDRGRVRAAASRSRGAGGGCG